MQCFDLLNKRFIFTPQVNINERFMRELINTERAKIWAQPLAFDGNLNESAESHSVRMITTKLFLMLPRMIRR